jgi:hypothetical protein
MFDYFNVEDSYFFYSLLKLWMDLWRVAHKTVKIPRSGEEMIILC